ncbi:F-box protein At4g22280-like isoform X1 [Silene latifolia]|uniref:F-box protein At4g22280-like isoform X1 n=1 Tax=Silene latifolia TaxID=37657 RepID=UPI003D7862E2
MTPPMKHSKHVEGSISESCLDRISSLPDDVLGHVLSFLPTKFAVSTSILSMRWRHLFTLTTCLSFEDEIFYGPRKKNERIKAARRFREFIDKVLELHQISPIKKFSLVCRGPRGTYDNSDLNRWVSTALKKGVQELHYEFSNMIDCMPDGFFTCETLVRLNFKRKDSGYNCIKIPLSARLPKLKILHLYNIIFFDFNSMERLFSSCELLQKLTLEYCRCGTDGHATHRTGLLKVLAIRHCSFEPGTLEIDAPNLAHLQYCLNTGVKIVPSWKNSYNSCSAYDDFDTNVDPLKYDHELLIAAASKAIQLRFKMHFVELFFQLDEDEHMPKFPIISSVLVRIRPYYVREYATRLIGKSPQLETVIFESCFLDCRNCSKYYTSEDCDCNSRLPSDIPHVPFSCQVIEVHKFCGHDSASRSLLEHLLTNASRLKTLTVHILSGCDLERDLEISKYLLMLPRASIDCHVEIKFGSGNTTLTSIPAQR